MPVRAIIFTQYSFFQRFSSRLARSSARRRVKRFSYSICLCKSALVVVGVEPIIVEVWERVEAAEFSVTVGGLIGLISVAMSAEKGVDYVGDKSTSSIT